MTTVSPESYADTIHRLQTEFVTFTHTEVEGFLKTLNGESVRGYFCSYFKTLGSLDPAITWTIPVYNWMSGFFGGSAYYQSFSVDTLRKCCLIQAQRLLDRALYHCAAEAVIEQIRATILCISAVVKAPSVDANTLLSIIEDLAAVDSSLTKYKKPDSESKAPEQAMTKETPTAPTWGDKIPAGTMSPEPFSAELPSKTLTFESSGDIRLDGQPIIQAPNVRIKPERKAKMQTEGKKSMDDDTEDTEYAEETSKTESNSRVGDAIRLFKQAPASSPARLARMRALSNGRPAILSQLKKALKPSTYAIVEMALSSDAGGGGFLLLLGALGVLASPDKIRGNKEAQKIFKEFIEEGQALAENQILTFAGMALEPIFEMVLKDIIPQTAEVVAEKVRPKRRRIAVTEPKRVHNSVQEENEEHDSGEPERSSSARA